MDTFDGFGVLVIGDEILAGRRADRHLAHVIETLGKRGRQVVWSRGVGDDRRRLAHELKLAQQDVVPVFCFGGIGATPDDQTRQAAAEAFGVRLVRHPEAAAMIEKRFGAAAYPARIRLADLPQDCRLIPNAYNQIPGFTLYDHHFLPGFPDMAWPMLDWVLDTYYPLRRPQRVELSLRIFHAVESELIQAMNDLSVRHPDAKLFSLPHMAEVNSVELGFRGMHNPVEAAFADLVTALKQRGVHFEMLNHAAEPALVRRAALQRESLQGARALSVTSLP